MTQLPGRKDVQVFKKSTRLAPAGVGREGTGGEKRKGF